MCLVSNSRRTTVFTGSSLKRSRSRSIVASLEPSFTTTTVKLGYSRWRKARTLSTMVASSL
jgi:hypothetical protein